MTGGLIQLTAYTGQDVFLTGNPQITFFKSVYRRHTNFAIETVELPFQGGNIAFGEILNCNIDKLGDLMWKTALVVDLPSVSLMHPIEIQDPQLNILLQRMQTTHASYTIINNYMRLTMAGYRAASGLIQSSNPSSIHNVTKKLAITFNSMDPAPATLIRAAFQGLLARDCAISETNPSSNLYDKLSLTVAVQTVMVDQLLKQFDYIRTQLQELEKKYWKSYQRARVAYYDATGTTVASAPTKAKFAWIRKLGHFLIEWIEILIGGNRIDRQWGEWINIWHELTGSNDQQVGYDEMIGDVPEMTNFDTAVKPAYRVITPIPFWFCRDNGLALPLIALNYYDVRFQIKFRKMEELCYTNVAGALDPDIVRIADARMWVDYIYLDAGERRRFAQSSHEYLIQQVQMEEFTNLPLTQQGIELHFTNPVKELVWIYQADSMISNTDDTQEPQWDNYTLDRRAPRTRPLPTVPLSESRSIIDLEFGLVPNRDAISLENAKPKFPRPSTSTKAARLAIKTAQLVLNQQNRTDVNEPCYFQHLQPYRHHKRGGLPGLSVLSFADKPEITQPTGSCNMGRLDKAVMDVKFNYDYLYNAGFPLTGKVRFYALSYNVLRFMSGICGLAFISGA